MSRGTKPTLRRSALLTVGVALAGCLSTPLNSPEKNTDSTSVVNETESEPEMEIREDSNLNETEQWIVRYEVEQSMDVQFSDVAWGKDLYERTMVQTAVLAYYRYEYKDQYDSLNESIDDSADDIRADWDGLEQVEAGDDVDVGELAVDFLETVDDGLVESIIERGLSASEGHSDE